MTAEGSAGPVPSAERLASLRRLLVSAELSEQHHRDNLAVAKAQAEMRAIEIAGGEKGLGANAESRERALTLALAADEGYQSMLRLLRIAEEQTARADVEVMIEEDLRRDERFCRAIEAMVARDSISALADLGDKEDSGE